MRWGRPSSKSIQSSRCDRGRHTRQGPWIGGRAHQTDIGRQSTIDGYLIFDGALRHLSEPGAVERLQGLHGTIIGASRNIDVHQPAVVCEWQRPMTPPEPAQRAGPHAVERGHHPEPQIVLRGRELEKDIPVGDLCREASGWIEDTGITQRKDVARLVRPCRPATACRERCRDHFRGCVARSTKSPRPDGLPQFRPARAPGSADKCDHRHTL